MAYINYKAFVDFRAIFDSMNRDMPWDVLRKAGVPDKLYRALREFTFLC